VAQVLSRARNLETQVDTDDKPTSNTDQASTPARGRAVPLWEAAEPLWQRLHGVYSDHQPARPWSQAIEPIARRLTVENQIVQALGWAAAVCGVTAVAMFALKQPSLAALLVVAAGTTMTAFFFYRANRATHPLRKLANRFAPHPTIDPLVEGMLALFSDGEIKAYPNPDSEILTDETPIGPGAFASIYACLLFHEDETIRRAAVARLPAPAPINLAVSKVDLAYLESRLRPLKTYPDLIGMPEWIIRRAENASLRGRGAKDQLAIEQLFIVLRANANPNLKGRLTKQTLFNIETAVKADSAETKAGRSTLYNITGGKHVTGKLIRFR
jgi:hypothetical protein